MPEYLNYLWSEGVPPGSPYMRRRPTWLSGSGRALAGLGCGRSAQLALAELARWRPQAVVADAKASSPLGQYLVNLLGPPSVRVDDLIGWRNPVLTGLPASFAVSAHGA